MVELTISRAVVLGTALAISAATTGCGSVPDTNTGSASLTDDARRGQEAGIRAGRALESDIRRRPIQPATIDLLLDYWNATTRRDLNGDFEHAMAREVERAAQRAVRDNSSDHLRGILRTRRGPLSNYTNAKNLGITSRAQDAAAEALSIIGG